MPYEEALWRTYAKVYDTLLQVIPYRNLLLDVVERSDIKNHMRLLDVGAGTGNLLTAMTDSATSCAVTALDLSKDMMAHAHDKVAAYTGSVDLIHTDVAKPVSGWGISGLFDRIVINNVLWVLDDPPEVLSKLASVATDRAIIVASTPRPDPNVNELLEDHLREAEEEGQDREETLKQLAPLLRPLIQCNEALFVRYGNADHLPAEPKLRHWFEGAGWRVDEITTCYAGQNWMIQATKM